MSNSGVLEYYFSRVAESLLHDRLASLINNPNFRVSSEGLNSVISAVRGQDGRSSETELLRNVLHRFIQEDDLIKFIKDFEGWIKRPLYSKRRVIFGESLSIPAHADQAMIQTAIVLKHIRNAIVHSNDRYFREDCHIPLSDSEDVIEDFIPLVRFCAERVIFGSAI